MRMTLVLAKVIAAALVLVVGCLSSAHASFINSPVPGNAFITEAGRDWAWAMPVPSDGSGGFGVLVDLTFQGPLGWHVPTAADLAVAPLATHFLFAGANVPFNGTDAVSGATFQATNGAYTGAGACAAP